MGQFLWCEHVEAPYVIRRGREKSIRFLKGYMMLPKCFLRMIRAQQASLVGRDDVGALKRGVLVCQEEVSGRILSRSGRFQHYVNLLSIYYFDF